ncbi:Hypothetical protein RMP42_05849 [Roseomonas mucosa]|nr:Hypothetical protein RMP42_05849 [Roseomonas mucosa]
MALREALPPGPFAEGGVAQRMVSPRDPAMSAPRGGGCSAGMPSGDRCPAPPPRGALTGFQGTNVPWRGVQRGGAPLAPA